MLPQYSGNLRVQPSGPIYPQPIDQPAYNPQGNMNPGNVPFQSGRSFTDNFQPAADISLLNLHARGFPVRQFAQLYTPPTPPMYVNVPWSSHQVPYSQSLTPPKGWVNPATVHNTTTVNMMVGNRPATPPHPLQHQSVISKILGWL